MKFERMTLVFAILLFASQSIAQSTRTVNITKVNGEKIEFETKLAYYKGRYVFPDDSKEFIKGKIAGKKVNLPKEEIKEIEYGYGSKYLVYPSGSDFYIGFYLSKGKIDIFKTYSYGHQSYGFGAYGTSTSINKVVTVAYYVASPDKLTYIDKKDDINKFKEECPVFNSYLEEYGRLRKDEDYESALLFYNKNCE